MRYLALVTIFHILSSSQLTYAESRQLRDIVGVTHVAGKYNFGEKDFLNEGADRLLDLGTRVIKLWFTPDPQKSYPFNSSWPPISSLVDLAKTPYFQAVFSKPFTTFILETYAPGKDNVHYFTSGMTPEDIAREKTEMYLLTRYLLTKYRGTGKTFVLQNWESDWVLTNPQFTKRPSKIAMVGMIDWLNARQAGVEKARREAGTHGVMVAHAAEVNLVARAMEGKLTATNNVIPYTHCDLYSYSSWDTSLADPEQFRRALDYLAGKAPDSKLFGSNNIYVGEFGAPENVLGGPEKQLEVTRKTIETALDWGARWVVYWELYCNEPQQKIESRPSNSDMRGFWLIRPDGSKPPVWDYLAELLKTSR